MKKILAIIFVATLLMSISVQSFASDVTTGDGEKASPLPTVLSGDGKLIPVEEFDTLSEEDYAIAVEGYEQIEEETSYIFWSECEEAFDLVIEMNDITANDTVIAKFYDGEWFELETSVEKDGELTIHIEKSGLVTVSVLSSASSITAEPTTDDGGKASPLPTVLSGDGKLIPVEEFDALSEEDYAVAVEGYEQIEEQTPAEMETRYVFWSECEEAFDLVIEMDDITVDDTVVAKLYDGEWSELETSVEKDGEVTICVENSGLVIVMTEIPA